MKEAIIHAGPKVEIVESAIPKPNADQVLIRVMVSGSNPKDWKLPERLKIPHNSGDDIAGIVEATGEYVTEFHPGDRVAAFHEMKSPHGSFAQYAIAWAYTTFHLPKRTSFEEAATVPLAAMTAALGLYMNLRLSEPWHGTSVPTPLIIYGAAGAVGSYAIKLAQASNIQPILAVAGNGKGYVETLIDRSKGDTIIDYRNGNDGVVSGLKTALQNANADYVEYAFDAVCEKNSFQNICKVLASDGKIAVVRPGQDYSEIPEQVRCSVVYVGCVHDSRESLSEDAKTSNRPRAKDFAYMFFRLVSRGLQEGWFLPHPHEVVPGGLSGIEEGLVRLKAGKASAVKYVFRISDEN